MIDSRVVEAQVGLTRTLYKLQVFDENQQEIGKLFQQTLNLSEFRPLMAQIFGLAKSRIEAHQNSGALLRILNNLDDEIHMRTAHLHKIASVVIEEQQKSSMASVALAAAIEQTTAMYANFLFLNINWKKSQMTGKRCKAHLENLQATINDVVRRMNPTVMALCEVGEVSHPLSEEQMQLVADQVMDAWQNAATERIQLRCMFTQGSPYLTIYIDGPFQCSNHQILHDLYSTARGQPRDAQTFVCSFIDMKIDVINAHAPSGSETLEDSQRRTLLTNLLQSKSQAKPGYNIGHADFLLGGDMNTGPHLMSQLLHECRNRGLLRTQHDAHEPAFPGHEIFVFPQESQRAL